MGTLVIFNVICMYETYIKVFFFCRPTDWDFREEGTQERRLDLGSPTGKIDPNKSNFD
jgi:hypothetical protein